MSDLLRRDRVSEGRTVGRSKQNKHDHTEKQGDRQTGRETDRKRKDGCLCETQPLPHRASGSCAGWCWPIDRCQLLRCDCDYDCDSIRLELAPTIRIQQEGAVPRPCVRCHLRAQIAADHWPNGLATAARQRPGSSWMPSRRRGGATSFCSIPNKPPRPGRASGH